MVRGYVLAKRADEVTSPYIVFFDEFLQYLGMSNEELQIGLIKRHK